MRGFGRVAECFFGAERGAGGEAKGAEGAGTRGQGFGRSGRGGWVAVVHLGGRAGEAIGEKGAVLAISNWYELHNFAYDCLADSAPNYSTTSWS